MGEYRTLVMVVPLVSRRWRAVLAEHVSPNHEFTWPIRRDLLGSLIEAHLLTDRALTTTLGRFRGGHSLNLSHCRALTDAGLARAGALLSTTHDLFTELSLRDCGPGVTDVGLAALTAGTASNGVDSRRSSLLSLDLASCSTISDQGIAAMARNCPRLKVLSLAKCHSISDAGIVCSFCALESLDLGRCFRLSDHGLHWLTKGSRLYRL